MLMTYVNYLRALLTDEEGASAVEYGLILGLIAVVIIGVLITVGTDLNSLFGDAKDGLETATGAGGSGS